MTPRLQFVSLVLGLVVFLPASAEGPPPLGVTSRAIVARVIDGDTVDVMVSYLVRIRLLDLWAPEKNTAAGEKAWEDLEQHIAGKDVVVHIPTAEARSFADVTTLGRALGHVYFENQSVSEWQRKRGNGTKTKP